jgi:hypothetical protein
MNTPPTHRHRLPLSHSLRLSFFLSLLLSLSATFTPAATISGNVANLATRNLLEGARVEIPALHLSALTDATGRYVLAPVPAGTHDVEVTYIGLDKLRRHGDGGRGPAGAAGLRSYVGNLQARRVQGRG